MIRFEDQMDEKMLRRGKNFWRPDLLFSSFAVAEACFLQCALLPLKI
jgi:hypothetical protein